LPHEYYDFEKHSEYLRTGILLIIIAELSRFRTHMTILAMVGGGIERAFAAGTTKLTEFGGWRAWCALSVRLVLDFVCIVFAFASGVRKWDLLWQITFHFRIPCPSVYLLSDV
jgi:hypothetical protein